MADPRDVARREVKKTNSSDWAKQQKSYESTCYKLPPGVESYRLEQGVHKIDFMPYIAGKGNKAADEGFAHFERTYKLHRIPMPNGKSSSFVCFWDVFKKKCPVCNWLNKYGQTRDKDLVQKMKEKTMHLWVINDKPGDQTNPLKVLDTNHYNKNKGFGEQIVKIVQNKEKWRDFWDLENGYTAEITIEEETFPGGKYNVMTRIDFDRRDYKYNKEMYWKAPCLDDMLIPVRPDRLKSKPIAEYTEKDWEDCYNEYETILNQGGSEEADPEPAQDTNRPSPRAPQRPQREEAQRPSSNGNAHKHSDEDDDDTPTPPKKTTPVATSPKEDSQKQDRFAKKGLVRGKLNWVMHEEYGKCEVIKFHDDDMTLTIEDDDGKEYKRVDLDDLTLFKEEAKAKPVQKQEEAPAPKAPVARRDPDDDDDDDDLPPKKPAASKPVANTDDDDDPTPRRKAPVAVADDDDLDD